MDFGFSAPQGLCARKFGRKKERSAASAAAAPLKTLNSNSFKTNYTAPFEYRPSISYSSDHTQTKARPIAPPTPTNRNKMNTVPHMIDYFSSLDAHSLECETNATRTFTSPPPPLQTPPPPSSHHLPLQISPDRLPAISYSPPPPTSSPAIIETNHLAQSPTPPDPKSPSIDAQQIPTSTILASAKDEVFAQTPPLRHQSISGQKSTSISRVVGSSMKPTTPADLASPAPLAMSLATRTLLGIGTPNKCSRGASPGFALGMSALPTTVTAARGAKKSATLSGMVRENYHSSADSSTRNVRMSSGGSSHSKSSTSSRSSSDTSFSKRSSIGSLKKLGLSGAPARRISITGGTHINLKSMMNSKLEHQEATPPPPPDSPPPDDEEENIVVPFSSIRLNAIDEALEEEERSKPGTNFEKINFEKHAHTIRDTSLVTTKHSQTCTIDTSYTWEDIVKSYSSGQFIAEGGYKRVFRVELVGEEPALAMSVLNLNELCSKGLEESLVNELHICQLLNQISRNRRCPHFLQMYESFRSGSEPPHQWNEGTHSTSKSKRTQRKVAPRRCKDGSTFQYAVMQLADGGDMEEASKLQAGCAWMESDIVNFFFQMLFALHVGQKELELRHYDIKLLNFFLMTPLDGNGKDTFMYGVCGQHYSVEQSADKPSRVILADFGTSDIEKGNFGMPISSRHFTTLENTPPEYLLHGTAATQGYGADSWALGLCLLHLLTGYAPYEELLEKLECPQTLQHKLIKEWSDEDPDSPYGPLRDLCEEEGVAKILCDTLYRYLCLFGASWGDFADCKVWIAIQKWLSSSLGQAQYEKDCLHYSSFSGQHERLVDAQSRMAKIPGSKEMLEGLTELDPAKRWSTDRAISSEMFFILRKDCSNKDSSLRIFNKYI